MRAWFFSFFLGIFFSTFIIWGLYEFFTPTVEALVHDDNARIGATLRSWGRRNRNLPAIVMTGGSDVREAWDHSLAQEFFRHRGLQYFNLAHSSSGNSVEEQAQMISALKLGPADIVFFNVGVYDMLETKSPVISPAWETISSIRSESVSPWEWIRLLSADILPGYRQRSLYKQAVQLKNWNQKNPMVVEYFEGMHEVTRDFQSKVNKFKKEPLGSKSVQLDAFQSHVRLMVSLRKKYGSQVVFVEVPRNPAYKMITTVEFQKDADAFLKSFGVIRLNANPPLKFEDYFDFNHVNAQGRFKFSSEALSIVLSAYGSIFPI
jgi:hypothetical protein